MKKVLILLATTAFSGSVYAADACQVLPVRGMDCVEQQDEAENCQFICFERKGKRKQAPSSESGFYMVEQPGMDCIEQQGEVMPEHQYACFSRIDGEATEEMDAEGSSTETEATEEMGAEGDGTEAEATEEMGAEGDGTETEATEEMGAEGDGTEAEATEEMDAEGDGTETEATEEMDAEGESGDDSRTDNIEEVESGFSGLWVCKTFWIRRILWICEL